MFLSLLTSIADLGVRTSADLGASATAYWLVSTNPPPTFHHKTIFLFYPKIEFLQNVSLG